MKIINKKQIGLWIKQKRIFELEMSLDELGSEVGKAGYYISKYESCTNMAPGDVIFKIERLITTLTIEPIED